MAIDIRNLKPSVTTTIKHGSITIGHGSKIMDSMKHYSPDNVKNTPVIADIDDKYQDKYDDPTYYN